jgi:two-component system cell cycle sensor histidine kinase/response regulator CckA
MKLDVVFALENAAWPALLVDGAGVVLRANDAAIKFFGSVAEGQSPLLSAVLVTDPGVTAEQFLAQWERAPSSLMTLQFRTKGGAANSFSTSICSFAKDGQKFFVFQVVADLLRSGGSGNTEVFSIHKQKLDMALQLARTVSMDFNNALTSILGYTSLLLSQTPPTHPWRASLIEMEKASLRAAEIASDLGAFSWQEKVPRTQTAGNLNDVAQRSVDASKTSRADIEWTTQLGRNLYASKFDEAKMQQAFLKILENATEAIGSNGRITVQTRNVELAEAAQDRDLRLAPGTYVCAEISDNGSGIAPENLPKIFEPFFTTKKDGKHRGLGLALVYGIVTNHGGGIAVSSQQGLGTSVRLYLPAEKKLAQAATAAADLTGNQTILVVDDEESMLTVSQTVLSTFGYRVLTANSGQKAVEILSRGNPKIDLVLTDLLMPSMSGRELIEHVRHIAPEAKILRMSGFVRPPGQEDDSLYLQKPFSTQDLLGKVKRALTP